MESDLNMGVCQVTEAYVEQLFACKFCDIKFTHPHMLKIHSYTHKGMKQIECTDCGKAFKYPKSLYKHRRNKHNAEYMGSYEGDGAAASDYDEEVGDNEIGVLKIELEEDESISIKMEGEHEGVIENQDNDLNNFFIKDGHHSGAEDDCHSPGEDGDIVEVDGHFMDMAARIELRNGKYNGICEECGKQFKTVKGLNKHTKRYHDEDPEFFCTHCGKGFISEATMTLHETTHTSHQSLFECNQCGKLFAKAVHLKAHELTHSGDQRFKCTHCDKSFSNSFNLKRHALTHDSEHPYDCNMCDNKYERMSQLNKHLKQDHSEEYLDESSGELVSHSSNIYLPPLPVLKKSEKDERQYLCTECGTIFDKAAQLRLHTKVMHLNERPFQCTLCAKSFPQSSHLHVHIKLVHNRERPFACSYCSKKFGQSSHVRMHIRAVHYGERPYSCPQCDKKFVQSAHVTQHFRLAHSEERPYSCEQCNKTFVLKYHLTQHVKLVHNGERPYPCELCEKKFRISSHLKEHMKTSHSNLIYVCTHCDMTFKDPTVLRLHIEMHG